MYTKLQERPNQLQGQQLLRKQLLLIGILFVCCVWVLFQIDLQTSSKLLVIHAPPPFTDNYTRSFLVNTKGCRIQDLDPYDPTIIDFLYDERPVNCNKDKLDMLVKSAGNVLYVDMSLLPKYNLTEDTVKCCYSPFWRQEAKDSEFEADPKTADTTVRYTNDCTPFTSTTIEEQFISINCQLPNGTYRDYFVFVNMNETEETSTNKIQDDKVSVLLIGVDAVSRLNLHRQMPNTVEFLKNKLKAVEMLGYNKVGDNTFPNLIPVLTGLTEDELKIKCWPNNENVFDNCPFIWKNYKENGYLTGYGEDSVTIGLFNYIKVGFRKQPTDFYLQTFNLVAEDELGHEKWLNAYICMGKRLDVEILLNTIEQFAINLKNRHTFGFFWSTSLTHDYLNLPRQGDKYYLNLFNKLYENNIFNNSVVIFLSDHGMRWGNIRQTYQGYLEDRLPFLFINYPTWFKEKYPHAVDNLRANRKKLTSPFDLHETLKDLIHLKNITNEMLQNRLKVGNFGKGISLFIKINESRNCKDAGIPNTWCTCHQSVNAPINDIYVQISAKTIVNYINNLLHGYNDCSKLNLFKILNARIEYVPFNKTENQVEQSTLIDYTITIETIPGNAKFEATVRYRKSNNNYSVMAPVSRINTYGNQSYCIGHYLLKLYCYCNTKYYGTS